jgi:NADPH-dependent 2,4-dienoyl-CoA reductase/sulfur reductase-like enzyme/nitrite reductase/ring-hydroxylating ferredoxin subunit
MGGTTELSGPDLEQGIALDAIPEDGVLLGHAQGEAVLVVRRGADVYALGASCTHYGGPLAEGLLVGDTVRCPWHHACFDLRTGEALRPPALNDVAAWHVEQSAGQVRVTGRKPALQRTQAGGPTSVVIVGGGAAGESAAEALRREGYTGPLTVLEAGSDLPYDKPNLSKDYLAGHAPEEWIALKGAEFYREKKIDLRLGRRVTTIDAERKRLILDDGTSLSYDVLLLAMGAQPIRLPPEVARAPVHYLRTFADSKAIIAASSDARRAVVIGASFIGLEVAASLRARGLAVSVIAPESIPLERVMGAELGRFIRALHEERGVVFHLGRTSKRIEPGRVILDDDTIVDADLVVAGIGVRPDLMLAEAAGLSTDRGILVDGYLETSVPGIFAAGDLARWPMADTHERVRVEHWVVAQRQGKAAALNMLGRRQPYLDVPFFWSAHYDVVIAYVGHAEKWDRLEVTGDIAQRDATVRFIRDDRTIAAATIFRDRESLEIEVELEKRMQRAGMAWAP